MNESKEAYTIREKRVLHIVSFLTSILKKTLIDQTSKQLTVHDDTGGRLALWYHIYCWRYGISTVGVMVYLRLAIWYHIYSWRYGIISTVPYEQQKIYRQIILFQRIYNLSTSLTGLPCHREPSIVLMSMD